MKNLRKNAPVKPTEVTLNMAGEAHFAITDSSAHIHLMMTWMMIPFHEHLNRRSERFATLRALLRGTFPTQ